MAALAAMFDLGVSPKIECMPQVVTMVGPANRYDASRCGRALGARPNPGRTSHPLVDRRSAARQLRDVCADRGSATVRARR